MVEAAWRGRKCVDFRDTRRYGSNNSNIPTKPSSDYIYTALHLFFSAFRLPHLAARDYYYCNNNVGVIIPKLLSLIPPSQIQQRHPIIRLAFAAAPRRLLQMESSMWEAAISSSPPVTRITESRSFGGPRTPKWYNNGTLLLLLLSDCSRLFCNAKHAPPT